MIITNKTNLSEQLYRWAVSTWRGERPDHGISVTELIAPAQQQHLLRDHADRIEIDVTDILDMVDGTAWHAALAPYVPIGASVERRLWMVIDGVDISGQIDLYDGAGVIIDHKRCSRWAVMLGKQPKPEWVQQLNIYALLAHANSLPVHRLRIEAWLKDWSATEASRDAAYPQSRVIYQDIPLWPHEQALAFARGRLQAHQARPAPPCTPEERWETATVFAIHKPGRKSAVKLYEAQGEAQKHAADLGAGHYVQTRPGASRRCQDWCMAASVCPQWLAIKEVSNGRQAE